MISLPVPTDPTITQQIPPMKRFLFLLLVLITGPLLVAGCQSTTAGGATDSSRSQLLLISSEDINQGAATAYQRTLSQARSAKALNTSSTSTKRVRNIANRLIAQVGVFRPDALKWNWEINVIDSEEVNAYCMPGGKIAVYSGIISSLNLTDDELAAVIGHEMAHALREHSREQVSQQIAADQALSLISALAGFSSTQESLAGMASQLVMTLPFSRTMETEADIMGMELMARAGYNPEAAINVWKKMEKLGGDAPPELLSTHPSDESRIARLQAELPKVMPLYQATATKGKTKSASSRK